MNIAACDASQRAPKREGGWFPKGRLGSASLPPSLKTKGVISTCNHAVSCGDALQHLLDEPHFGARLQVADALLEDGGEDAPDLRLTGGLALVQQLHHAPDALWLLDDEVHLQVKLASNQLTYMRKDRRVGFQSTL